MQKYVNTQVGTEKKMGDSLKDRNFLIAGGSSGIGLSLVDFLLTDGANVFVYSRTNETLPVHDRLTHTACDFLTDDFKTIDLPESIDGIAYCPGSINLRSFRSLKLDDFRQDYELNVIGAIRFIQGCLAGLKRGSTDTPASIVLFSTIAASKGLPMHASISAAKSAIEGLTRSLAAELAPAIRVNCLAPALTDTPLASKFLASDEKRAAMNAKYPLGRVGTAEDLASMAAVLLNPAQGWITGQVIGIDGGMSAVSG